MLSRFSVVLLLSLAPCLAGQSASETHAAAAFDAARKAGPPALHAFLEKMPKGADLHMHLSGAVYAETFLKDAVEDQLCVDPVQHILAKNSGVTNSNPPLAICSDNLVSAAAVFKNQKLYDAFVDAFSMRSFVPSAGVSGHDQFFATFDRFGGLDKRHTAEWLDEVAARAAAQNEQYLEVMMTPAFSHAATIGYQIGWPAHVPLVSDSDSSVAPDQTGASAAELAALRDKLLAAGLREEVAVDREQLDGDLAGRERIEHCGEASAAPACSVQIRVIYQVLRAFPPQQVFAQTLLAFEVASADPNVVGLNFVQPEDAYMAMSEYHRQMQMLDYLHSVYPKVHISLHAGEVAPGMVPPAGLRFHIREAVDLGHAERIGHGVDAMDETDPKLLLKELAERHVMVEINLTSNDVILGVTAPNHPLPSYRAAHVPVALSTDDEGVSRIDLTHEYTRAALEFNLSYAELKQMVRTGMEHTFLPGASLWQKRDEFTSVVAACANQPLGVETPKSACVDYLKDSPHAAQQWELEHRFRVFEGSLP
jgi:adenosine deaminase